MFEHLKIVQYPDPRLKRASKPVTQFDDRLRSLVARMIELMHESKGVGLAAPQVGENLRVFVVNPSQEPGDDRVYINPELSEASRVEDCAEEGCLSLPGINAEIARATAVRIDAFDLEGKPFNDEQGGYIARIWQHEFDHLNGTLIIDRMGMLAKLAARKTLKELEDAYAQEHARAGGKKD